MNSYVEKYYLLLIHVMGSIAQYYSTCQQPEVVSFIREPILSDNCATEMYGSIMCNRIHGCNMFKKIGHMCIFYSDHAGCVQMGTHNTKLFKKLSCPVRWSLKDNICYRQTMHVKCIDIQSACQNFGGIAAEFYSAEEMNNALNHDDFYVGGSKQNGVFLWDGSQQQINSTLWLPNEPDSNGDCVQIMEGSIGLDALESRFKRGALCEEMNWTSGCGVAAPQLRLFHWV